MKHIYILRLTTSVHLLELVGQISIVYSNKIDFVFAHIILRIIL